MSDPDGAKTTGWCGCGGDEQRSGNDSVCARDEGGMPGWRACTVLYCWCSDSYDTIPPGRIFGCSWLWFLSQGMNVWCILHVPTPISQGTGRPRSLSLPATALQRRELFPRPMPTAPFSRGEPEMPEAEKPRIQSGATSDVPGCPHPCRVAQGGGK